MLRLLFISFAAVISLANSQISPPSVETEAVPAATAHQILVMLRRPPVHYRGGETYQGGYVDARTTAARERTGKRLAKRHGLRYVGFYAMSEIGLDCVVLEAAARSPLTDLVTAIERDSAVDWAEPVETYRSLNAPSYNDPLFMAAPAATQWHLAELHRSATGKGVTVAMVDSSVDVAHPDLAGQLQLSRNFVDGRALGAETHGTGVAGVIAAKANNNVGMVGIAPQARLLGLRACWQNGDKTVCDSLSIAKALNFALGKNVDVLNLSLTGPSSRLLAQLLDKAIANRTIVVAAVDPVQASGGFPASSAGVIAVTGHATRSMTPNIYRAPGNGVPTTQPNGRWYVVNGSSYSAAHVSGLYALMIEMRGESRSRPVLVKAKDGGGTIDARASLRQAARR